VTSINLSKELTAMKSNETNHGKKGYNRVAVRERFFSRGGTGEVAYPSPSKEGAWIPVTLYEGRKD